MRAKPDKGEIMVKDPHNPPPSARAVQSWLDSYKTGLKLRLTLTAAAFLVAGLLAAIVTLIPLPRPWSQMRPHIFFSLVIFLILASVVWLLIKVRRARHNRARQFDQAWAGLAQTTASYATTGRQYHGTFGSRKFDAYASQVRAAHGVVSGGVYQGDHLEIVLDSEIQARLKAGVLDERLAGLGDRFKGELTGLREEAPEGLMVYVHDPEWGRRILKDRDVSEGLARLVRPGDQTEMRNLSLWPGAAMLSLHRVHPGHLTGDNIKQWLTGLADWLKRLESLDPPDILAEVSKWDDYLRGDRKKIFKNAVLIVVGILGLVTLLILGILWLLIRN